MNNVLQLKGTFEQASSKQQPGISNLPAGKFIKVSQLEKLQSDLIELRRFWAKENIFPGALISVYYNKIAAKSNRIKGLLSKGGIKANSSIVGARFSNNESPKHIITHYVSIELIDESIERLKICIGILIKKYRGIITHDIISKINSKEIDFTSSDIAKTNFFNVVVDAFYVEKFDVLVGDINTIDESIITIYKTETKITQIMEKLGISLQFARVMDDTTILLRPDELALLKQKAPYLISMSVSDITKLTKVHFELCDKNIITIPTPQNEPIIGVIDTMFDENVYFSEWVDLRISL